MNAPTAFAMLPLRPFGLTGMSITRVGFGAWAIGGPDWAVGRGARPQSLPLQNHRGFRN